MKVLLVPLSCLFVFSCASSEKIEGLRQPAEIASLGISGSKDVPLDAQGIANASVRYKTILPKNNLTNIDVLKEVIRESFRLEAEYENLEAVIASSEMITSKEQYFQKSKIKSIKLADLNSRATDFLKNARLCFKGSINVPQEYQLFNHWAIQLQETNMTSAQTPFNAELKKTPGIRAENLYIGRVLYNML